MAFRIRNGKIPKNIQSNLSDNKVREINKIEKIPEFTQDFSFKSKNKLQLKEARSPKLKYLTEEYLAAEKELADYQKEVEKHEKYLLAQKERMEKRLLDELHGYDGVILEVPGGKIEVHKTSFSRRFFNQKLFQKNNPEMFERYYELRTYSTVKVVKNTIYDKSIDKMLIK